MDGKDVPAITTPLESNTSTLRLCRRGGPGGGPGGGSGFIFSSEILIKVGVLYQGVVFGISKIRIYIGQGRNCGENRCGEIFSPGMSERGETQLRIVCCNFEPIRARGTDLRICGLRLESRVVFEQLALEWHSTPIFGFDRCNDALKRMGTRRNASRWRRFLASRSLVWPSGNPPPCAIV